MKILHPNLNILDIKYDDRDNAKEQCRCISIVVPSKTEWLIKKQRKQHEGYHKDFYCLLARSSKIRNLKQNKEDIKYIFSYFFSKPAANLLM